MSFLPPGPEPGAAAATDHHPRLIQAEGQAHRRLQAPVADQRGVTQTPQGLLVDGDVVPREVQVGRGRGVDRSAQVTHEHALRVGDRRRPLVVGESDPDGMRWVRRDAEIQVRQCLRDRHDVS